MSASDSASGLLSQSNRFGSFQCALPEDTLSLLRFNGSDHINNLFSYRIEALSADPDVDMDKLLGTRGTVRLGQDGDVATYFDGIIARVSWLGAGENGHRYDLELKPWLWLASKARTHRIFKDMTALDIIQEVLTPYSSASTPHLEVQCLIPRPSLEYTVQYGESDMAFVMRLMEAYGVTFYFTHTDSGHTMRLVDDVTNLTKYVGTEIEYTGVQSDHQSSLNRFTDLRSERNIVTGAIELTDYDFKNPERAMMTGATGSAQHSWNELESFEYPGNYVDPTDYGPVAARLRQDQETARDRRLTATGDTHHLQSGMVFELTGDRVPVISEPGMVCISATHSYVSDSYGSVEALSDEHYFSGTYVLQPETAPLAPTLKTPVPRVQGPLTGRVVAAAGSDEKDVDCDSFGRILVRFPWDREDQKSMRCRVSQNWAGQGWGGMVIPRIGMEVVVEFLDGNPDKPLVSGCVYNGSNPAPEALPTNRTKSVFRTNSFDGGGGFNELTFDDFKDEERIYMHAQKDHEIMVQNDRTKTVGHDEKNSIGNDRHQTVGANEVLVVKGDRYDTVEHKVTYRVKDSQQEKYTKDHVHFVGNIHKQDIYADHLTKVGRNVEAEVMGDMDTKVTGSITTNTGTHTLMAFKKFEIKGPGGKITLDASGVTIEGPMINLKGLVNMQGSGSAQVPVLTGAANDGLPLMEVCLGQEGD